MSTASRSTTPPPPPPPPDEQYLTDKEIEEFLDDLDENANGEIEYSEVELKLDEVHKEIAPKAQPHNLHHKDTDAEARHLFLRSLMGGTHKKTISRTEFREIVKGWKVPSMNPSKKAEEDHDDYMKRMSIFRRMRAYWEVRGPEMVFLVVVLALMAGMGGWQLGKYLSDPRYRQAFGWGVVLAKTSAGILYPTFFFLITSMSRYLSTFARKSYYLSRFINWDLHQMFHVKISCVALFFATLHAIGHLTGSFLYGSRPAREQAVAVLLGPDAVPRPYRVYIASLPGWSGLTAFGLFWTIAALSAPYIRKNKYEIFQAGHLLMFPMLGLLCAHGTAALLQFPMLGYWLAFPTLLVIVERVVRIINGFIHIPATIEILDGETVRINATIPNHRYWSYQAGQYIFLQVPELSFFQWHPFTISTCIDNEMQVHIKTDGDWTSKLRDLAKDGQKTDIKVGIDGPYGAPAQRFYDFNQSIILGSGIGVTPFSGILTDLKRREDRQRARMSPPKPESTETITNERSENLEPVISQEKADDAPTDSEILEYRIVHFHWVVKDRNFLLWFSDLLNEVSASSASHRHEESPHLDVHILTHCTQKRKSVATHTYRYLLELHRTDAHPYSPITGLLNPTHFGRPDLEKIMNEHYLDMCKLFGKGGKREHLDPDDRKVGVFFCGAPPIGYELADRCKALNVRGREEENYIEYHFMMEVFG